MGPLFGVNPWLPGTGTGPLLRETICWTMAPITTTAMAVTRMTRNIDWLSGGGEPGV